MSVNPDLTEVVAILDGSASMGSLIKSVTEGINAFVNEQKKEPGECFVTVYTFDGDPNKARWALHAQPLIAADGVVTQPKRESSLRLNLIRDRVNVNSFKLVGPKEYRAEGTTPLNDAIMRVMNDTGKRFAAMPEHERPGNVIIFVSTDGEENDSAEYPARGNPEVTKAIRHQEEKYNWHFIFTGSDPTTYEQAAELGVSVSNVLNYHASDIGTKALYGGIARKVSQLRRGEVQCCAFTDEEKAAVEGIEDDASDPLASNSDSSLTTAKSTTGDSN